MLRRLIFLFVAVATLVFVSISLDKYNRARKFERNLNIVKVQIKDKNNIFEAKEKLKEFGYDIKYGPDFPTSCKTYYLMIIDFGLSPSIWEKLKYTLGVSFEGQSRSAEIRASSDGKITSVR